MTECNGAYHAPEVDATYQVEATTDAISTLGPGLRRGDHVATP